MTQYSIDQAKERFAQVMDEVEEGNTVEVTRNGQKVAIIIPIAEYEMRTLPSSSQAQTQHKMGFGEGVMAWRKEYGLDRREEDEWDKEFETIMENIRDKSPGRDPFEW